jgi:hypothetical protein
VPVPGQSPCVDFPRAIPSCPIPQTSPGRWPLTPKSDPAGARSTRNVAGPPA